MKRKKSGKSGVSRHSKLFLEKQKSLQERFLEAFRRLGRQGAACKEAGVSEDAVWDWREKNPNFEAAYLKADARIGKLCEDEAIRRAIVGIEKGVYYEGEKIDTEIEYSDALLAKILAARNRMYRSTADDGTPLQAPHVTVVNYGPNTPTKTPNNASTQLPSTDIPAPHIKSYR